MYVNCVLAEHLAECKRFKSFLKCKVVKSRNQSSPSSFFGFTFLYLPNVFIHEPNEFIHVRVVNKLSKFKFTTQRLSDLVLTYSVGKGDFQIVLSIWLEPVVCDFVVLAPRALLQFNTPAVQLCPPYSVQSVWQRTFLCESQKSFEGT